LRAEESVSELAKLGSRVHLFDAKAGSLESKLADAHTVLRERLFVFDRSFWALGLYLENFLVSGGRDRIMQEIDPRLPDRG
jgi:hypothetical protein